MKKYGEFAKATCERAVKTVAQAGVALITANATGLLEVDWVQLGSVAGLAGVVSVLTSIASAPFGGDGPSLSTEMLEPRFLADVNTGEVELLTRRQYAERLQTITDDADAARASLEK